MHHLKNKPLIQWECDKKKYFSSATIFTFNILDLFTFLRSHVAPVLLVTSLRAICGSQNAFKIKDKIW